MGYVLPDDTVAAARDRLFELPVFISEDKRKPVHLP